MVPFFYVTLVQGQDVVGIWTESTKKIPDRSSFVSLPEPISVFFSCISKSVFMELCKSDLVCISAILGFTHMTEVWELKKLKKLLHIN